MKQYKLTQSIILAIQSNGTLGVGRLKVFKKGNTVTLNKHINGYDLDGLENCCYSFNVEDVEDNPELFELIN